jgi:hypothetical protein
LSHLGDVLSVFLVAFAVAPAILFLFVEVFVPGNATRDFPAERPRLIALNTTTLKK